MLPCLDRYADILVKGEQHVQCLIQEHEVQSQWAEGPQEKDEGGMGTRRTVTGTAGPQGGMHAVSKPQPKADKGARCSMYVLAGGNVVNRKGSGLKIKASSVGSSSVTNCAVTWARVHWSSTGLLRPPLADSSLQCQVGIYTERR